MLTTWWNSVPADVHNMIGKYATPSFRMHDYYNESVDSNQRDFVLEIWEGSGNMSTTVNLPMEPPFSISRANWYDTNTCAKTITFQSIAKYLNDEDPDHASQIELYYYRNGDADRITWEIDIDPALKIISITSPVGGLTTYIGGTAVLFKTLETFVIVRKWLTCVAERWATHVKK
jgi:hypothetical protein